MPSRSAVPGEKFSTITSASSTSFQYTCLRLERFEVEQQRLLAAVQVPADARLWGVDLDHFRAEFQQQAPAGGAGQRQAEVQHLDALQRVRQVRLGACRRLRRPRRLAPGFRRGRRPARDAGLWGRPASRAASTGRPAIHVGPSSGSSTCTTAPIFRACSVSIHSPAVRHQPIAAPARLPISSHSAAVLVRNSSRSFACRRWLTFGSRSLTMSSSSGSHVSVEPGLAREPGQVPRARRVELDVLAILAAEGAGAAHVDAAAAGAGRAR